MEFLKGEIEAIPLADASVDVIISNCVINLSSDKDRVLGEAFRVLKPGGRFAVSDVVVRGHVPDDIRRNAELWIGCIAGALDEASYREKLAAAGFESVAIELARLQRPRDRVGRGLPGCLRGRVHRATARPQIVLRADVLRVAATALKRSTGGDLQTLRAQRSLRFTSSDRTNPDQLDRS